MRFTATRMVGAAIAGMVVALVVSHQAVGAPAGVADSLGHSMERLSSVKAQLDQSDSVPDAVTSWYVDVDDNVVVVEALPGAGPALAEFVEASAAADELVRVEPASSRPQLLQPWPISEGDPYYTGAARCTVGFLVRTPGGDNGFVTAGHCGRVGNSTQGFNQQPQGMFQQSVFPGSDWALVILNDDWIPTPIATGSQEASVGASVCKIGSTTGQTCGTITARNVTVNYPEGTVTGLTRTTLCAEPGDSGGPVFAGTQGQGIISGGSGNCSSGGTTFFQPLNPVLAAGNLSLLTA